MYDLSNIPATDDIKCEPILDEDQKFIGVHVFTGDKLTMVRIMVGAKPASPSFAEDIGRLATACRNRGIKEGKNQVRQALGIHNTPWGIKIE